MSNRLAFFAIHATDVDRARAFYSAAFGWTFRPWGPPGFYLIETVPGDQGSIQGSLHPRLEPLEGRGMRGFECSVSVDYIDDAMKQVTDHGGTLLDGKTEIPGVGWVARFQDPEGNQAALVQYRRGGD